MSYSTIMVPLDLGRSNAGRLQVAAQLAMRFNSGLIGIAAGDIQPLYFVEGAAGEAFLEKERTALKDQIASLEQEFRRTFQEHSKPVEWRSSIELPAGFLARHARAADLIVAASDREAPDILRQTSAGDLVLRAGRPVLVVPPGTVSISLKTVVVAWKDCREARRAVSDALPLLHLAQTVIVVELVEEQTQRVAAKARVDDVAVWLRRRGIAASSIVTKELIGASSQLELIAEDEGADIIVAGAYGHTRFSEWVFGGVTRDLLRSRTHCALMSH